MGAGPGHVLTIYNHGTGGSSAKPLGNAEIVNIFSKSALGRRDFDYILTEGVGALGGPHQQISVEQNMSGTTTSFQTPLDAQRMDRTLKHVAGAVGATLVKAFAKDDAMLQASGIGADENVVSVVNKITAMVRSKMAPRTINMMGWSRGAVTCIRIAYFLSLVPDLARIPVNIFAVDPVAGKGHDEEEDARTLHDNVENYVATLAMHENRGSFAPMEFGLLRHGTGTRVAILPLPGHHSDTAKHNSSSGALTFHMCARFLRTHGTKLDTSLTVYEMDDASILREYRRLTWHGGTGVHWNGQSMSGLLKGGSPFSHQRAVVATQQNAEFVNAHHYLVEQRLNPRTRLTAASMSQYLNSMVVENVRLNGL